MAVCDVSVTIRCHTEMQSALDAFEESTGATRTRILTAAFLALCALPDDMRAALITEATRVQRGRTGWSDALRAVMDKSFGVKVNAA